MRPAAWILLALLAPPTGGEPTGERVWSAETEVQGDLSDWIAGPMRYLLTRGEVKQFKRLESAEERLGFVEAFWARRDPSPSDPERNEYRDEFWRRVEVADLEFRRGDNGWDSARGEVYIIFGPPSYQSYEQDARLNKPLIQWFYERRPTKLLPITFRLWFSDLYGTGRYYLVNRELAALHPQFWVPDPTERIPSTFRPALDDVIQRSILWEVEAESTGGQGGRALWSKQAALEGELSFDVRVEPIESQLDIRAAVALQDLTYVQVGSFQVGEVAVRIELGTFSHEETVRVELDAAQLESVQDQKREVRYLVERPEAGGTLRVTLTEPVSGRQGEFEEAIPPLVVLEAP
ncbi:MAG TPA: GWxTD domain-containing protein [Acidobacteriota bacterium]